MKQLIRKLIRTDEGFAPLIARLALALVILPHGLQKTLGMFGGYGFSGTMNYFTGALGVPAILAFLVIMAESLGALSIVLGFLTRFSAASLAVVMAGAVQMVHWGNGFFMNWSGNQTGEGFEYHLLVIGLALSLVISGAGKFSIDLALSKRDL